MSREYHFFVFLSKKKGGIPIAPWRTECAAWCKNTPASTTFTNEA